MRQVIYQLKYRNLRALVSPLAQLLDDYLISSPVPGEVQVPIPLLRKRLSEWDYNQSSQLARDLSKLAGLPVIKERLIRQQPTPSQAKTSTIVERQSNVADAFASCGRKLQDKEVLLVDDLPLELPSIPVPRH